MPGLLDEDTPNENESKQSQVKPTYTDGGPPYTTLPNGVVVDKNGKPCRTCTSSAAWKSMMKSTAAFGKMPSSSQSTSASKPSQTQSLPAASSPPPAYEGESTSMAIPNDCPPDVEELGRSSWTLLHTLTASYPPQPDLSHQRKTHSFLQLFSQLYPCWVCAEDFQTWMAEPENDAAEALKSQEAFGRWMCRAHNAVNVKLGKKEFDCNLWKSRWKDGWKDGRCD